VQFKTPVFLRRPTTFISSVFYTTSSLSSEYWKFWGCGQTISTSNHSNFFYFILCYQKLLWFSL